MVNLLGQLIDGRGEITEKPAARRELQAPGGAAQSVSEPLQTGTRPSTL